MADAKVEAAVLHDTKAAVAAVADPKVEVAAVADPKVEVAAVADANKLEKVAAVADAKLEKLTAKEDTNVEEVEAIKASDGVAPFSRGTNVFGEAVTQELLMSIPEYANRARKERADVANQRKYNDGKYEEAVRYVRQLKANWGNGVSTLCVLYNGTGETLRYVTSYDWFGRIEAPYPQVIANGQWGAFFHTKTPVVASGSQAAVVYRGKNRDGEDTDWMVAWDNPWNTLRFSNNAYAEIHPAGYFDRINWGSIANAMVDVGLRYRAQWRGCVADVQTERDTSPLYEAVLSLE
ncbi:hypothetical protein DITRI_Ditri17bG0019000 [Diplodiscus trichospermus]